MHVKGKRRKGVREWVGSEVQKGGEKGRGRERIEMERKERGKEIGGE